MAKTPPRVSVISGIRAKYHELGDNKSELARMLGISRSTASRWLGKRSLTEKELPRARQAAQELARTEKEIKAGSRQLERDLREAKKSGILPDILSKIGLSPKATPKEIKASIKSYSDLTRLEKKIDRAIESMTAKEIKRGEVAERNREGEKVGTLYKYRQYDGLVLPKTKLDVQAYRIFGVDKDGKIVASTLTHATYKTALENARSMKVGESWKAVIRYIVEVQY